MTTKDVIDRYYETVNAGDWASWLTLFADDIAADDQLAGHLEGIAGMRGQADGIQAAYSTFHMQPEHVVIQGDEAAVIWRCQAVTLTGAPLDAYGANYFTVQDGLITYIRTMHDTVPFQPSAART